ncbi:MAG: hypothetical protein COA78_19605 [Blastopirellula sp.]|nr:MAG: hypothetical protein COA78_19605 [Blastopirellula sp.]
MSAPNNYSDHNDSDPTWMQQNAGFVAFLFLMIGTAAGAAGSLFYVQSNMLAEMDGLKDEIYESRKAVNKLTAFEDSSKKANTLLANLEEQKHLFTQASRTMREIDSLKRTISGLDSKISSVNAVAFKMQSLLKQIDSQAGLLSESKQRVSDVHETLNDVDSLIDRINGQTETVAVANETLDIIEGLHNQVVNQQCVIPELVATIEAHKQLENDVFVMASSADATRRAIESLGSNQARIQEIAFTLEETQQSMNQVESLITRQQQLAPKVVALEVTLESTEKTLQKANQVHNLLIENRASAVKAFANLDELLWICEHLGAQDEKLIKAEENLYKINIINDQVMDLDDCADSLVDQVKMIQNLNIAMSTVLNSSNQLRSGMGELMLLQPAIEQLTSKMRHLNSYEFETQMVNSINRKQQLLDELNVEKKTEYISSAK